MTGRVDDYGRALLPITLKNPSTGQELTVDAWIDTGFTGKLLLTQAVCDTLGLIASSEATIMQSDGIPQRRATFLVSLDWFGEALAINAIGGATRFPLLGVHLLAERILTVDYIRDTVSLSISAATSES